MLPQRPLSRMTAACRKAAAQVAGPIDKVNRNTQRSCSHRAQDTSAEICPTKIEGERRPWSATFLDRPKTYSFVSALVQSESSVESAYPWPRDRRLSRKTRAAVGKPSGSTTAVPAVSGADNHGAATLTIGHQENFATTTAVANHIILAQYQPVQFSAG